MKSRNPQLLIFLYLILFISSCMSFSSTTYRNTEEFDGSTEWGPLEIQSTVSKMVESISVFFENQNKKPYIELDKITNKTSEHIDTNILSNEISSELIKKKIVFVDTKVRKESLQEIANAQRGIIDEKSKIDPGKLLSPNYKLMGDLTDNVIYEKGRKKQFILVTLKMINIETGAIEWQDRKNFYKISNINKIGY